MRLLIGRKIMNRFLLSSELRAATLASTVLFALSGCATSPGYAPRAAFPVDQDIKELHDQFDTAASIKAYYAAGADTEARRNEFAAGRLALYDLEYIRFISRFRLSRAEQNTAFDAVALGIGFATTIVAGERAKTILGAVTTALVGARSSYEKNFYDDKTSAALVAQMTAERKKALIPIVQGLAKPAADYPLTRLVVDLANYQMAGTVDGALTGVQQDAAQKDASATAILDQYRTATYDPSPGGDRIRAWLWPGFAGVSADGKNYVNAAGQAIALDASRVATLRSKLPEGLQAIDLGVLIGDPRLDGVRASLIKDIPIP
jgi:ribosomal protein L18